MENLTFPKGNFPRKSAAEAEAAQSRHPPASSGRSGLPATPASAVLSPPRSPRRRPCPGLSPPPQGNGSESGYAVSGKEAAKTGLWDQGQGKHPALGKVTDSVSGACKTVMASRKPSREPRARFSHHLGFLPKACPLWLKRRQVCHLRRCGAWRAEGSGCQRADPALNPS